MLEIVITKTNLNLKTDPIYLYFNLLYCIIRTVLMVCT